MKKIVDGTHHTPTYVEDGVPFLSVKDVRDGKIYFDNCKYISQEEHKELCKRCYPEPGDLLITKSGTIGRCAVVNTKREFSLFVSVALLKPAIDDVNTSFISLAFQAWFQTINVQNDITGSAIKNFHLVDFRKLALPLPPLNEQRRIVTKIEALKARSQRVKEELEAIPALLDQFRQSVLAAAFRGDLTADWQEKNPNVEPASVLLERIRAERRRRWEEAELEKMKAQGKTPKDDKWKEKYEEPTAADTSDLPAIPKSWTWATLPEIGELNRGKSKHRPRNDSALFGGSYPFIQTGEIRSANGVISNFSQTYSEFGLKQSRLWSKGTLCITIAANIAETAILGFPACFPDSVVGFLPETSGCDVRFVEFFMRTAKNDLERFAPATAQKNINLEILRVVAIPFPPLEEQQKIIAAIERYFSVAEAIERMLSENSEQIQHLEQSILAKAFRGELVPQDPNDEPASVLLERIHVEREKLDTKKNVKGKSEKKSRKAKPEAAPEQLSLPGFE
ncbi:MAG: restriction endonuclease subunit S [Microcoleus sp. SIO2G3]|nr:restriction endonuclease subunit S [Microcoleus sp. SIO2G3]